MTLTCKLPSRVALHASCLLLVALLVSCPYMQAAFSAERTKITNDRREVVGYIYKPCDTCKTQITDDRRNILGYIEDDGDIVDTRRNKVLELEFDDD